MSFSLGKRDLELLARSGQWTAEPSVFKVMLGSSSTDLRLEGQFEIGRPQTQIQSPRPPRHR